MKQYINRKQGQIEKKIRRYVAEIGINKKQRHRIQLLIAMFIGVMGTGIILHNLEVEGQEKLIATQESLAEEVLRFHVLANSNTEDDQALKLLVRDEILSYIEETMEGESTESLNGTQEWVEEHLEEIIEVAQTVVVEEGYEYIVNGRMTEEYFPVKVYGDLTFPEGRYLALKIEIGEAAGENWWCCLYPSLCFIDTTYGVVSEEGKEDLQEVLTEDEYGLLTESPEKKVHICWFFSWW